MTVGIYTEDYVMHCVTFTMTVGIYTEDYVMHCLTFT